MNDKCQCDNTASNQRNDRMDATEEKPTRCCRQCEHDERWQPERNTVMPTKQVAEKCCACQESRDDDGEQENAKDKDREKHRASWVVPNRHENEAAHNGHDCKEGEANRSRPKMQKEQR